MPKDSKENDDILGLVAFGSLITNIFQIASKKSLDAEHEALKAYVSELRRLYENIRVREIQVSNENLELRRANVGLIAINNRLSQNLVNVNNELIKLKSDKLNIAPGRRKRVPSANGETN